jgi:outer membrane protein assembly factor BamE (lipoprotein component of BamABCDE complex)
VESTAKIAFDRLQRTRTNRIMKAPYVISLLVSTALLGFSGCASDQGQKPPAQAKDTRPREQRLSVGMTKDEVRKALGDPAGNSVNSDGEESWRYSDAEKAFIPFYSLSGGKIQFLMVNFDKDGKVKNWSSTKQGAY